jgi:hypothetical protein
MPPGVGPAALIFFIPFVLIGHALAMSGLRAVMPKQRRVEEHRHESEEPQ